MMEQVLDKQKLEGQEEKSMPAYKKLRGFDRWGKPMFIRIDTRIQRALDSAIKRNKEKNWDYTCIVAGYCGVGKSVFSQGVARYCDDTFDESKICFTAEEFIKVTNEVPEFSAVILDESFQSMNSRVTMSPDFLKVINHLQILRQKHLFIFLNLPNFFDLSKNVSIFRSNHLFVCYSDDDGNRGRVLVFDRGAKRRLFIKGHKFLDYNCEPANFRGRFWINSVIPESIYERLKFEHLEAQDEKKFITNPIRTRANLICYLKNIIGMKNEEVAEVSGLSLDSIKHSVKEADMNLKKRLGAGYESAENTV
ncbi:MAG TPA: hypothetical protein VMV95_03845 [Bacillota bacterium]|nr:hypothetical protein [Bacillota bacterium]